MDEDEPTSGSEAWASVESAMSQFVARHLRELHDVWRRLLDEAAEEPVAGGLIDTLRHIEAELTARVRGEQPPR